MVMNNAFDGDVRVNIDLPPVLHRKLAGQSVEMGTDLQNLIRQIIECECAREEYVF